MSDELGSMTFAGRTWPVRVTALQLTVFAAAGKPSELFLGVGSANTGGCGFSLENYALRPGVTLDDLGGGRICVREGEIQPGDTLSVPDDESLVEASNWSIEDPATGEVVFWFFRDLDLRFERVADGRFRCELRARLVNLADESTEAAAECLVQPEQSNT